MNKRSYLSLKKKSQEKKPMIVNCKSLQGSKKKYKLKNENIINEEVITSQETPAVQNTIQDTIFEKIEELRTEQQEDIGQALDERKDTDFLLETTEEQHTTK